MIRVFLAILWILGILIIKASPLYAVEIPSYAKENLSDVKKNMRVILKEWISTAQDSQSAEADAKVQRETFQKQAAMLYAEALTTRSGETSKEEAALSALDQVLPPTDQQEIMADKIQPYLISIAERLNSIMRLEAGIAALEGVSRLHNIQGKDDTDVLAEIRDDKTEGEAEDE